MLCLLASHCGKAQVEPRQEKGSYEDPSTGDSPWVRSKIIPRSVVKVVKFLCTINRAAVLEHPAPILYGH